MLNDISKNTKPKYLDYLFPIAVCKAKQSEQRYSSQLIYFLEMV